MPPYYFYTDTRSALDTLRGALWTERQSGFDAHWKELGDFLLPRRTRFWTGDRNKGDRRNQNILDSTARFAVRTLASGLHAGLTSPARPWMKLQTPDPDLAMFGPVKEWLHIVTQRMLTVFLETNLYNVLPMIYQDLGVFGTAAMSVVEDSKDLFRCYCYPIGTYALGQGTRGLATTFVRDYELTVRQIVEEFGVQPGGRTIDWTRISPTVKGLWDRGDYERPIEVCWMVRPNDKANAKKLPAKFKPWSSFHFETGTGGAAELGAARAFLRESGFDTFPILAPRWDITGEDTYGTDCPGMTALGDIKQLQSEQRKKGQTIQKSVDPPLQAPTELRTQKTSLLAGDITYVNAREGMAGIRPIHETRLDGLQFLTADIAEVQYRIQRAFYEDLFLMLARTDGARGAAAITAREVDERHEEKLLALGPVLERTNDELLDPLVDRVFDLMERTGLLPPPPPDISGVKLRVEYTSIMAQAQKLVGVAGHDRFMQNMVALVPVFPEIRHKVNVNQYVDDLGEMLGINPNIIRPNEEADALADQERQAMQAESQSKQALNVAQAAKAASETPMTVDSALAEIMAAGAGGPASLPA